MNALGIKMMMQISCHVAHHNITRGYWKQILSSVQSMRKECKQSTRQPKEKRTDFANYPKKCKLQGLQTFIDYKGIYSLKLVRTRRKWSRRQHARVEYQTRVMSQNADDWIGDSELLIQEYLFTFSSQTTLDSIRRHSYGARVLVEPLMVLL